MWLSPNVLEQCGQLLGPSQLVFSEAFHVGSSFRLGFPEGFHLSLFGKRSGKVLRHFVTNPVYLAGYLDWCYD